MSECQLDTTEEKIKVAARELFSTNGLKGTTIRKVAEKADVNVALVNYYFRSKDKLFVTVFEEKFREYVSRGNEIFKDSSKEIFAKIEEFIDCISTEFINDHGLPIFLMSELHHNPELLSAISVGSKQENLIIKEQVQASLDQEHQSGNIRKIDALSFETMIVSMVIFPIISRLILVKTGKLEIHGYETFEQFIKHWKSLVLDIVKTYLKPI